LHEGNHPETPAKQGFTWCAGTPSGRECQASLLSLWVLSAQLTLLERAIAVEICLSVRQTRVLCQNDIILCKYISTVRWSDISSFLGPNFVLPSLGIHPERETTPVESADLNNNLQ